MSCLLVEDITSQTTPTNLETLLSSFPSPDLIDHVLAVVYTLMLEAGFVPLGSCFPPPPAETATASRGFSARRLKIYSRLPPGWQDKSHTLHKQTFQLADFTAHKCQLVVSRMCDVLTVNLTVDDYARSGVREPLYTLRLLPWMHVTLTPKGHYEYMEAGRLAAEFKDNITTPVVCGLYSRYSLPHAGLLGIPDEVTLKILRLLPISAVSAVARSCKRLYDLCQDDLLWQHLYKRDAIQPPHDGGDGDQPFKVKYSKAVAWNRVKVVKMFHSQLGLQYGVPHAKYLRCMQHQ